MRRILRPVITSRALRQALLSVFVLTCALSHAAKAQRFALAKANQGDTAAISRSLQGLARQVIPRLETTDRDNYLNTLFRLQTVSGEYAAANMTLARLRELRRAADSVYSPAEYTQYEIYSAARLIQESTSAPMRDAIGRAFSSIYQRLDDKRAYRVAGSFDLDLAPMRDDFRSTLARLAANDSISQPEAVALLRKYHVYTAYDALLPHVPALLKTETARRYVIDDSVLIRTRDGSAISAIEVRPRALAARSPSVLSFTIYAQARNLSVAMQDAANGYVGIVANTRGKRNSLASVAPFEHDGDDAYDVIGWISRQSWSNGKVGMFGGSYEGFTQWASLKNGVHPALKTIVPSVAVVPGFDTPVENSIYQGFQYPWVAYVTNVPLLDDATYNDRNRWSALDSIWFAAGTAYRSLDSIDGKPNPIFQRWLSHPSYDAYWQAMTPQGREFARIHIPILTTTGYFDGAQGGALHYFRQHLQYNPTAEHYLLIGPWDHFGSQGRPAPVIAGYVTDPAARLDITGIIYQWMDYVMKGGTKPAILKDRINYEVMGANTWKHAPTLQAMNDDTLTFYLRNAPSGSRLLLGQRKGTDAEFSALNVDLSERTTVNDNAIHDPLADSTIDMANGIAFESEPLREAITMNGSLGGTLRATINKRDMDIGVQLYEHTPAGQYFQLSFYLGRASYAKSKLHRRLLVPGAIEDIPLNNTRMISRQLSKGSRLVVVVNVNKSSSAPINYGTGKNVSDETIADAGEPLQIKWLSTSTIRIPIHR